MKKFVVRVWVLLAGTMAIAATFGFTSAQSANAVPPRLSPEIRQGPRVLKPTDYGVGRYVQDLAFTDLDGQEHRLSDFEDQAALVLVLTGTGCPLCLKYAPTLATLEAAYQERSVSFVFINPNESESVDDIRHAVQAHGLQGAYVHDVSRELVRALDARTSTEAFVLDGGRTLVYRGAVDDQYGLGYVLDAPRQTFLSDALDAVLQGSRPRIAATWAPGCELFLDPVAAARPASAVTYHNRISRLVQDNCLECHRQDGLAPLALETYEQVSDYAGMIQAVVQRGIMPPWFAAPHDPDDPQSMDVVWANDRSLSAADRTDLLDWLAAGLPIGDAEDAPVARQFPDQWMIGEPDLILQIPQPIAIQATGQMPYQYVRIKTQATEDRWIQALEVQPTDQAVVHHVLVFVQPPGQERLEIDERSGPLAAYVPGNSHSHYPPGFAKKLPAGASLVFQLHYTPYGTATTDQTRLGLVFAEQPPQHIVRSRGIANTRIAIPPHAKNHAEQASMNVPIDARLLALMPHMHLRGKAFRYDLVMPDGQRRRLLDVPRYDFNWQLEYRLAEPLDVPRGSRIEVTGWFDNSAGNPANPDPTRTVRWGLQTDEEMLLGYLEYYVP
ncbi:MAG: redoxin [Planctomycetaceae bacterium]|nr:MAG: redoxin [Planctomycetaceae bacterium]